jgi:putative acyl-CoA dehydrogenase
MSARNPTTRLATHQVSNQPPPLEGYNAFDQDAALREASIREGAPGGEARLRAFGKAVASEQVLELGRLANQHPPVLQTHDRYGQRIDEVEFHPAYHELMALGMRHQVHSVAWTTADPGGHVMQAALIYLLTQAEAGVCCPLAMTYAGVPTLRREPELAALWQPRLLADAYDGRFVPAAEKRSATLGMAMTEKQGGSDVRANTTQAVPVDRQGAGRAYELTGHKWFCSAPMSDAFVTLAQTEAGLSCFWVPRWKPDGSRNNFFIQRLKDKLGNRSNASSEIEYAATWANLIGEEGRGVATIIDMVNHTRLDAAAAAAGLMRQAVSQATHHCAHRCAFGKRLSEQPAMRNVLADLAVESEAATALCMRLARGFDQAQDDEGAALFVRLTTAVAKYWINKRAPNLVYEALECHGGNGYVEASIMPRLYREAPLSSIWEGSGNVMSLDVLRAIGRQPECLYVFLAEVDQARGADARLDASIDALKALVKKSAQDESAARRVTECMAVTLQGALLVRHAPAALADAFCVSRLGGDWGGAYGTLPAVGFDGIIQRAQPRID